MPMTPYDSIYLTIILTTLSQNFVDTLRYVQAWYTILDRLVSSGRVIPPVFPTAKIEQDHLA